MPAQYEAIRDHLISKGMPEKEAKKHAAMIYNASHPGEPVTRSSDKKKESVTKKVAKETGKKLGVDFKKIPLEEFHKGMNHEMEHADTVGGDVEKIGKMTHTHLQKIPDYYNRLSEMEEEATEGVDNETEENDEKVELTDQHKKAIEDHVHQHLTKLSEEDDGETDDKTEESTSKE